MIGKLLVANRGEIARRIIRTARRLGIATVAVYSDADRTAVHVREADTGVAIGPAPAAASYLHGDRIIAAALEAGADAIHPGYGFLSESADFAASVIAAGLGFVGPPPEVMRKVGDKARARALAMTLGVPIVPGSEAATDDEHALAREARRIGFPVMIKAAAGGGGRGMRRVASAAELEDAIASARREAAAAFGDGRLLVERAIARPRHIEIQVFGDRQGNLVHLFERECSLQRHHQKVIEEAPAPGMSGALRAGLTEAALRIARAAAYGNAGTFEFLVEGGTLGASAPFYFIEANPRLQVEHPVTEAITGFDLVEWQLRVAAGEPLPKRQAEIAIDGHAVEARVCAEDPAHGFRPDAGRIVDLRLPSHPVVRVESGVEAGSRVPPDYDSLILKAIAHGPDRATALTRLAQWLKSTAILGVRTNLSLLHGLATHPGVLAGVLDTGLIGREIASLAPPLDDPRAAVAQGAHLLLGAALRRADGAGPGQGPWSVADGFELGPPRVERRAVVVDGAVQDIVVRWGSEGPVVGAGGVEYPANPFAPELTAVYDHDDARALVLDRGHQVEVRWPVHASGAGTGEGGLCAPISGRVARIGVAAGDEVEKGAVVAVVEAMKMEHVIVAPEAGRVLRVLAREGGQVAAGDALADIVPVGAAAAREKVG